MADCGDTGTRGDLATAVNGLIDQYRKHGGTEFVLAGHATSMKEVMGDLRTVLGSCDPGMAKQVTQLLK